MSYFFISLFHKDVVASRQLFLPRFFSRRCFDFSAYLQVDPNIGECVVMSTVANGPAQIGGVLPGDAVLEVDGQVMMIKQTLELRGCMQCS